MQARSLLAEAFRGASTRARDSLDLPQRCSPSPSPKKVQRSSGKDDVCLGSRLPCDVDVVGREIQAILSQDEAESRANYSVFGVSPPRRSNNPVVRDSTFGRCVPISQAKAGGCIYSNKLSPSSALSTA